jgi:hypothetical protein
MLGVMFKKYGFLFMAAPLVAAIGGPLAYFKLIDTGKAPAAATVSSAPAASGEGATAGNQATPGTALAVAGSSAVPVSNVKVLDAASVFSFEITPEWILSHWPSVSTGLAQLQLEGYRVPLVTGTGQQDLAGALTYYFDARQRLQRINFVGVSGDPRQFIGLLTTRFRMTRRLTGDPGIVVYEGSPAGRGPTSGLQVRVAPLAPGDTYRRYDIEMSLERPDE